MFLTLIFAVTILAAGVFSAESLVVTIAGFLITVLGTNGLKNVLDATGPGSVLLAVIVSVVVAVAGIFAASFLGGDGFSLDAIVKQSGQIFVLATFAYHVFRPGDTTPEIGG